MPLIEEKFRSHGGRGLMVLALNVRQDRDLAAKFAKDVGISYPVLLDRDGSTAKAYGVIGLPTTFLIDGEGRIMEEIIGDMNRRSLSELLDPLFEPRTGEELIPLPTRSDADLGVVFGIVAHVEVHAGIVRDENGVSPDEDVSQRDRQEDERCANQEGAWPAEPSTRRQCPRATGAVDVYGGSENEHEDGRHGQ